MLAAVILVLLLGAFSFSIVEGRGFYESLYWAFITMTTIGYGDIYPTTNTGRFLAGVVAVSGIASFTAMVSLVADYIITRTTKRLRGEIPVKKRGHIVIAGWSEAAKAALRELKANLPDTDIVLVKNEEPVIQEGNVRTVKGDPSEEEVLRKASVDKATHVIVCSGDDSKNLLITLKIRMLNPKAKIIAEASQSSNIELLKQAGADVVVLSDELGGMLLASAVFEPSVPELLVDIASTTKGKADIVEEDAGEYAGLAFGEALLKAKEKEDAMIIAVRRGSNLFINPPKEFAIKERDVLLMLKTQINSSP